MVPRPSRSAQLVPNLGQEMALSSCLYSTVEQQLTRTHARTHTHTSATDVLTLLRSCDSNTWDYGSCHRAHVHTWQLSISLII